MHDLFVYLKQQIASSGLPVYDVVTHQGLLRHLVIREGVHTGQLLVNLVIASQHFGVHAADKQKWDNLLANRKQDERLQDRLTTLVVTENNGLADVVNGPDIHSYTMRGE